MQHRHPAACNLDRQTPLHEATGAGTGDHIRGQGQHFGGQGVTNLRRNIRRTDMKNPALPATFRAVGKFKQLQIRVAAKRPSRLFNDLQPMAEMTGIMIVDPHLLFPVCLFRLPLRQILVEKATELHQTHGHGLSLASPHRIIFKKIDVTAQMGITGGTGNQNRPSTLGQGTDIFPRKPPGLPSVPC